MPEKRTRIAYVLTPITFGGAEKVSLNFLRAVNRNRFDIRPILLTRPWEDEPYFAREIGRLGYSYDAIPVALKTGGDTLRVPRVAKRLRSLLKQGGFDLVHTHGYFADICGLPVARLLGLRSISTCHGFIANDSKLKVFNLLDKYALRLCQTVIAVSEGIKSELVRSGIKGSRIAVIPNAVEARSDVVELSNQRREKRRSLAIAPQEYVVGYLGRLSEEKGVVHLIEAVAKLIDTSIPVKLLIVGDGPERSTLERLVKERALDNVIVFTGFQTDVADWLSAFDLFVLPSMTEGTPMSLLEAMALGIPTVATKVGGVPKVVKDGVNGILVAPGDSDVLSDKIEFLKQHPDLSCQLGRAAAGTIKDEYGIGNWCCLVEKQYSLNR